MKIHVFFGVLTVVLLVIVIGSRRREAFTFDDVVGMARGMAVSDYMFAVPVLPKELRELNYDQHRDIRAGGTGTRFGAARVYPFKRAFFIPATSSIGRSTSTTKWPTNHSNVFVIRPSFLTMARTYFAREFRICSATRDFAFATRSISLFLIPEENLQLSPNCALSSRVSRIWGQHGTFPTEESRVQSLTRSPIPCMWPSFASEKLSAKNRRIPGTPSPEIDGRGAACHGPVRAFALLWDADSLRWLHHEFWSRPAMRLHPWWRQRLDEVIERIGLAR